ncbi:hypothetical protein ACSYAY_05745 [Leptospirillum ferriphilum]|jgi:hypothetical protein|uniref:Lipoprotein n=2 Tax=Leptospirillum TaxID=179 RepID=A0A2I2ME78_9BACT|nr:hypothetical protein [Leptospirillum ferriphilum]EDZ38596.1 MAG: Protein of unknown function [Leptospirillum sp. Group II '5-way CG']
MKSPALILAFGLACLGLSGCYTAPVPLNNQADLDKTGIFLPDTRFPSKAVRDAVLPALLKKGFHWNNPRYSLGHHLIKGNRLVLSDGKGHLSVVRYQAVFSDSGFRIYHYLPTKSGDIERRGERVATGVLQCVYNRPATAFGNYHKISFPTFLVDGLFGGAVNTMLSPALLVWCEAVDRLPLAYHSFRITPDKKLTHLLHRLEEQATKHALHSEPQKGKPIPRKVTTPASVE